MKRVSLSRVTALAVLLSACAGSVYGNRKSPEMLPEEAVKGMTEFFSARLSQVEKPYADNSRIAVADIERERRAVWQTWKAANDGFDEEKTIALQPLASRGSGSWKLPEDLEPGAVMPYYFGYKGNRPANGWPLYLYLHGSGPKANEWEAGIRLAQQFDDAPSIYFIPQMPDEKRYRWYPRSKQWAWEKLLRLAMLSGDVDPNAVYVFGISEGGYGSQRMASFYADYLAGAGPMAAGEPLKNAPVENCRNTAFSLRTGAKDAGFYRNTLTRYAKEEFERLQSASPDGFVHEIVLVPDSGHGIDYSPNTPWLKQHRRNPHPKVVSWENLEMDGRYRDGFYNLLVGQRSNDDESQRTHYEMAIAGNEISLRVDLVSYEAVEKDPRWGIEMKFRKNYTPATKGRVKIYLCEELVDLDKKVTVVVNGRKVFRGVVKCERRHLVESCAAFFDPERLYPAAIEIDLSKL